MFSGLPRGDPQVSCGAVRVAQGRIGVAEPTAVIRLDRQEAAFMPGNFLIVDPARVAQAARTLGRIVRMVLPEGQTGNLPALVLNASCSLAEASAADPVDGSDPAGGFSKIRECPERRGRWG